MTRLLTVREAAAEIGRPPTFVRRLLADEKVRGRKECGRWYVHAASLEAWVACGEPEPGVVRVPVVPGVVMFKGRRSVA